MSDGSGLAEKMLGLPGVVLDVEERPGEVAVTIESTLSKPGARPKSGPRSFRTT